MVWIVTGGFLAIYAGYLIYATHTYRSRRALWTEGEEEHAVVTTDAEGSWGSRRRVSYAYTRDGVHFSEGRSFRSKLRPLCVGSGEDSRMVVLVNPKNPKISRLVLEDEATQGRFPENPVP